MSTPEPLVRAQGLGKTFLSRGLPGLGARHQTAALLGVDLHLCRGEVLALVGESGSGKTTFGRLLVGVHRPSAGRLELFGQDVTRLPARGWRPFRRRVQLIAQDPHASLNPYLTVGGAIAEAPRVHGLWARAEAGARVADWLRRVGLAPDDARLKPHQFSGGQRQRVVIARALALEPELLVADEPVSALDPSVAAQILNLLMALKAELGLSYVFISHDLPLVRDLSDRVAILFAGRVVEQGPTPAVMEDPRHPYTRELISARMPALVAGEGAVAHVESGQVRAEGRWSEGCLYRARCAEATAACGRSDPPDVTSEGARRVRCFLYR